ncbi:MAG: hypothetical protein QOE10_1610, partial [Gaiellales bacterium]|nr:hypothetical protein [Gaiellales bacterium]
AVLDELRARRAEPRPELRTTVAERLAAPPLRARRVGALRPRRLVAAAGIAALAVSVLGIAGLLSSGGGSPQGVADSGASPSAHLALPVATPSTSKAAQAGGGQTVLGATPAAARPVVISPAAGRLQDYQAWMRLRVTSTSRLSQVAQRAISLTRGFGGYVTRSDVNVAGTRSGTADLDVHIPIARVQDAIVRFSSLGVIVGQHVAVADLQSSYDAAQRRAESLRHSLALIEVRLADPKVTAEQRVELLGQRERARHALAGATQTTTELASRGAYARLDLAFSTGAKAAPVVRHEDSRFGQALHRVGGILETAAIGALYAVLLGGPVLALVALVLLGRRARRRRSERALLARA